MSSVKAEEIPRCPRCFYVPDGSYEETLALNIRRLRLLKGYTQGDLANFAGLAKRTICMIETRKAIPRTDTVYEIAHALDTTVESLWSTK